MRYIKIKFNHFDVDSDHLSLLWHITSKCIQFEHVSKDIRLTRAWFGAFMKIVWRSFYGRLSERRDWFNSVWMMVHRCEFYAEETISRMIGLNYDFEMNSTNELVFGMR